MYHFSFNSYGVKVRVDCEDESLFETAVAVVKRTLLGRLTPIAKGDADHVFTLGKDESRLSMDLNGEDLGGGEVDWVYFKYFDTRVRLLVAEHAVDHVFMHAGVVGWNGKALVFPGDSYSGKTTLVAEFVKRGALYYSDEYAVINRYGLVHPFPRKLSIRDKNGTPRKVDVGVESLGGEIGIDAIPASLVLLTKFRPRSRWDPIVLTPGVGAMKMMPQAISLRFHSKFTLDVLNRVANRAMIAESLRGSAKNCVSKIIDFVDNS
ncbi:MAG: hypothetical protein KA956_12240 [Pyrinomonadaceae bacterium]|nr:hypothetical protein [Acidobacteriota bacterium]MBK7935552.1 hypothetical protein [Acidobacteriota bacterium]MBP7377235.1 hypothetical protein [Pyrinomonadaceae bacterium]